MSSRAATPPSGRQRTNRSGKELPALAPQHSAASTGSSVRWGCLQSIVGFHVARAAVATTKPFEAHIGSVFQLRKAEFSLLMLLHANGALAPKPLARALMVSAPNLTLLLDRLQHRGLVLRTPNPQDGRSQHVSLSSKGQQLAQRAALAAADMEADLFARLSHAERAMLIELLLKLCGPAGAR